MSNFTPKKLAVAFLSLFISTAIVGCEQPKGPAEQAGSDLDKAGRNLKDAVSPPKTPGEKIGSEVDRATGNK